MAETMAYCSYYKAPLANFSALRLFFPISALVDVSALNYNIYQDVP